jgi:2-(3-amino-3-carboxypropyl)histidine synthase
MLNCDKILHYAHTRFLKTKIPVEYVELREKIEIDESMLLELKKIRFQKIGVVYTLQFIDVFKKVKEFLEKNGKIVVVAKGKDNEKFLYPGQILGCDYSQALEIEDDVECFLVISSGKFHAKGLATKVSKPVFLFDVEKRKLEEISAEDFVKQKLIAQARAKECSKIGIIVSTKPGQFRIELAEKIAETLEKRGKEAYILVVDELKPEKFEYMGIDCLINTACPRVAIEERGLYSLPILNWDEYQEIMDEDSEN